MIELVDVSKAYRVYRRLGDILKEGLFGGQRHDLFWALRGISFSVMEGERIGIVGPNGAGKSTLLKLITGNLTPSSGRVRIDGRISALLSLIPALRKEETGLENIKLNLLMNGVDRRTIASMIDEIVDFTELSSFIYQPVRTYSSGMQARLAFAVATAVTPEILIVDEVLGTGDAYFQGKAEARMRDLCSRGKALLFVSHATSALRNLCDRVIWLENGEIRMDSSADFVLKAYEEDAKRQQDLRTRSGNKEAVRPDSDQPGSGMDLFRDGRLHLRVVADGDTRFHDTHFLTNIVVTLDNGEAISLPLELVDLDDIGHAAGLALLGTEWGRLHNHEGRECRELSAKIGRMRGGVLVLKTGTAGHGDRLSVKLRFEAASERGEKLRIECFDLATRTWTPLSCERTPAVDGAWTRYEVSGEVSLPPPDEVENSRQSFLLENRPDVAIGAVGIIQNKCAVSSVLERTPFEIRVGVIVNRPTSATDVCLKIMRKDGVYVFWQSSGYDKEDVRNATRDFAVTFHFDPNIFGPGEYHVSVTLGNGWDLKNNYPHSQVFDRKINAATLIIRKRHAELEFGVVNMIVPVSEALEAAPGEVEDGIESNAR
ncbi:MAG: ATP-binding cassette domain-containing protein [Gammaproteobacteria bacterium]|nr:ATP-binding cassette domain-containing protein [Gammaproteobacteria bacterium]